MTDTTLQELAATMCYQSLPRTPQGRVRRFQTWQTAIGEQVRGLGFERTTSERREGQRFVKSVDDSRCYDFATQHPDTVRAMLLSLVVCAADAGEHGAVVEYSRLLADFGEWTEKTSRDPFGDQEALVTVHEAATMLGISRQATLGLVKRGRLRGRKTGTHPRAPYMVSEASVRARIFKLGTMAH